jgi:hypothetical protein
MQDWCVLSAPQHTARGDYWEARISHIDGIELHADDAFMDALALKVMDHYESVNADDETLFLPRTSVASPTRTRWFYRSLFNDDGTSRSDFCTEASETLGLWIEQSLDGALYVRRGIPHNSDFAFDVLSIVREGDQTAVRIVQVKATRANLYDLCRKGAIKFGLLHDGKYTAVLKAQIDLMRRDRYAPDDIDYHALFLHRQYRIITIHEQDRDDVTLLANFGALIPGPSQYRTLRLVRVVWADFWEILASKVYAQLN